MAERKTNYPFELVARAAALFSWPKASLQESSLKRELRLASCAIKDHVFRLFPDLQIPSSDLKPMHTALAGDDLLKILDEIHNDPKNDWWATRFTTISMLDKFIVHKEREGKYRVPVSSKKIQAILDRF